jgi:hypothetical protein
MSPFRSLREYEHFVYTLSQHFSSIQRSTLVVIQVGRQVAVLEGELGFRHGIRLTVEEDLSLDTGVVIEDYGYVVWQGGEKLYWYDSQPHPNDPSLASTHPHHKHVPPDIKHNRIPAPDMSFMRPNLPYLLAEIEALLQTLDADQ